ncbi:MAG: 2,3,4,5-tetrahydropyridine-2,6-dicarboxylate N-succinyltransferase [Gammaproteobacteria bacterium]|jgi:2,3,4,5-tetrahydropyridine-2-carboxylate N-succinyltransferase|nr:2,3,4,5-tetrahydropyridine-2,6-dicarboxylate N-succinyltransferase [Gammaproteobacteria bacterium]
MTILQDQINQAWEQRDTFSPRNTPPAVAQAIEAALDMLDSGAARVAQPGAGGWVVNEWLKKAVLLSFRTRENRNINAGFTRFYDKVDLKYTNYTDQDFQRDQVRVVPHALVRRGAYVAPDVVLMPCYVNIGAHVGSGTMIDTWATVGSCAQIGSNVHISGGAGIGGVLEPLQASPTIIEDNCFIGARSEVVEGVIVERGAVISMGVFLGQSTRIYDRENDRVSYGRVPAGAVVVPGSLPAANGRYSLDCAVIVKRVDEKTLAKVGINELLRQATSTTA